MVTQHVCAIVALFLGQAAAECNIAGMSQTCAKHPPQKMDDKDPQKICKNPCVNAMLECASDPMFTKMVGKDTGAELETMGSMCEAGRGKAGDGTCNLLEITQYQQQLHGREPGCDSPLVKELFDCVDNPLLKKDRAKILELRANCQHAGNGHAGDGKCDILAIGKYEEERKKSGKEPDCGSNEIKEEFDCIDDPLLAHRHEEILALRKLCQAGGGKKGDCLSQINGLGPVFKKDGACCPPGDDCNDPHKDDHKPPVTCSAKCAAIWVPFDKTCGVVFKNMLLHDGDKRNDYLAEELAAFTSTCQGGH